MTMLEMIPAARSNLVLFRQDDRRMVQVSRKFRGTCTREQWDTPHHRQAVLAEAWSEASTTLSGEGYEFVTAAPVTLYRRVQDGRVVYADARRQWSDPPRYIWPDGRRIHGAPPQGEYLKHHTTYRVWAEGPLFHVEFGVSRAPTPFDDPVLQYYRNQNAALRDLIDAHITNADFAPHANVASDNSRDLVDFKIVGIFRRPDFQPLTSLQTMAPAKLRVGDGELVEFEEHV